VVIGAAIRIHKALGPGLLESAYEECLCYELAKAGLSFDRQKPLPIAYESVKLDCCYRLDLVVEELVVLELKCVEKLLPIHEAQLLTYLKLSALPLGLLINFHVPVLREGLRRLVLDFPSSSSAPPRLRGSPPPDLLG
jgi:GxxExxY protein